VFTKKEQILALSESDLITVSYDYLNNKY